MNRKRELTVLLDQFHEDENARDRLLALIYQELHKMAKRYAYRAGETLRPTALVNEAFIKVFGKDSQFENRHKMFAHAALAMRQIVLNKAEAMKAGKRGGDAVRLSLQDWDGQPDLETDYEALNDVLTELEKIQPRYAQILGLCYFAGFKNKEIADIMGLSGTTVYADLRLAKAWLRKKLRDTQA